MERNVPRVMGTFIMRRIIASEAFWDLTGTAIKVYMIFCLKCKIETISAGNRDIKYILNNGKIIFTFIEAEKKYGIQNSTFNRALDLLIKVGLIEVIDRGGVHHTSKYAISNNWRLYPEQTFERTKSSNLVGKKTRFKKRPPRS